MQIHRPTIATLVRMPCASILVIEDEPEISSTLKSLLELEGYPTTLAENGKVALELLHKMPRPCLILVHLLMPVMNGQEFLDAVSHEVSIATIPVCVVSGVADRPKLPSKISFIKKPTDFDALLKMVNLFCKREDPSGATESPEKKET